ncbi:MAG: carboxypeptidase regulatory-like domain-containing protein [Pyrinomonadaceae bacterium MAG19_C2-C3]|nr:carboxypeptidase regulatory-like domain-containing protein [Pyrinomonadaceae bacterium MAG19_C2-C3]
MSLLSDLFKRSVSLMLTLILCGGLGLAQQTTGTLRGQVADESGGLVVGATVSTIDANGIEKTATTNGEGVYTLTGLTFGTYTVRVAAEGFAQYENAGVAVTNSTVTPLNITLGITIAAEEVTVAGEAPVSTDPENNASAVVLREADIEALPDDPDDLAAALQALAGPGAGPNGGQIFIDGFTGGRLPPRETIREIRINSNPFSSEYDRLGFGRVEILTKPGTNRFRGQAEFEFEDESLNSRNPFAPNRAAFQNREYDFNLSGPIVKNKASFFLDFSKQDTDDNAVINALTLDPSLNITPFQLGVLVPRTRTTFSPRFDYAINSTNTLAGRYSYSRSRGENQGIGELSLPTRAFDTERVEHTIQLTETAIINSSIINETRFQYISRRDEQNGNNLIPSVNVLGAFNGGGSGVGVGFGDESRFEFQNYTTFTLGTHSLKTGARLRHIRLADSSPNNFAGTFTFAGTPTLTSLELYRNTLLNIDGAGPTQFTIAGGNPLATVKQTDLGLFLQDDWRVRPDLTLSFGLRYETQTNISSNLNFAPRFSFAYSPGANGQGRPKTVIRGGFGVFYDRFGENLTLQANRFNGTNQQQFIVTDPNILDAVVFNADGTISKIPTIETLNSFALPQTVRRVAEDLQAPYTMQTSFSIERQLPFNTTVSLTYLNARTLHLLRSRNTNAPLPGTIVRSADGDIVSAQYPNPTNAPGNIYQYESSGRFNQNQFIVNVRSQLNPRVSLFANYALNKANSDTDGAGTFAADPYDFTNEYGRAAQDIRHRFVIVGNFTAPYGISLSPFVTAFSGRPYNITTGFDTNGDTLFAERPTYTQLADAIAARNLTDRFNFTFDPSLADTVIPRNFGQAPSFFNVNLRASKTFGFGGESSDVAANQQGGGGRGGGGFGGGGFGGGRGGGRGGASSNSPYNLTFSLQVRNILNTTNEGTPVGNLSSSRFGQSFSSAGGFGGGGGQFGGNRRIEMGVRFSF